MNYEFPVIHTIDDVLPHIEGRPEFIVAERSYGTIINYAVAFPETFVMLGPDDLGGAIRRECRGLIFDLSGRLISRPFHKFFNISEKDETQLNVLDFTQPHDVLEKEDGSMVRPLIVDGDVRLGTKMGITDIADDATALLKADQRDWLAVLVADGMTPLLEYVSPHNKIVVHYDQPELVMTAVRHTFRGTYVSDIDNIKGPFRGVRSYGSIDGGVSEYIEKVRGAVGREGDIIKFVNTGHMVKLKADEYVRIHKVKDRIRTERNIADIIINNELDDVLPILDEADLKMVREFEQTFSDLIGNVLGRIDGLVLIARTVYGGDKKRVALELVPNLLHKEDAIFIFSALDNKDVRSRVIKKIQQDVGNTTKYNAMMEWMKGKQQPVMAGE